jgi:hypothetical protein
MSKSIHMNEEDCENSGGYFFKLTDKEKEILKKKIEKGSYNLSFIVFVKKLKNAYFQYLKKLLDILKDMIDKPIINNKTLNFLGDKTRKIIDEMYTLSNYYYACAIISLINSDISEDINNESNLTRDTLSRIAFSEDVK